MKIVKTKCDFCGHSNCSIQVHVESNRILKVEGDPNDPLTKGSLCPQALVAGDILQAPDRLKEPLARIENTQEWTAISWEEALTTISSKLVEMRDKYGPQSLVFEQGYLRSNFRSFAPLLARFAGLYGTPNIAFNMHLCAQPRRIGMKSVFGEIDVWNSADYEASNCIVLWGVNPSHFPSKARRISTAVKAGCKLMVIDPKVTPFAKKADLHLQLRPGTDGALALGMLNVIIEEELYHKEFVDKWTIGFEKLRKVAEVYPATKTSAITWINPDRIVEAARIYAKGRPSSLDTGNALDMHTNNFQAIRAIACLMAITGNLDVPGGNILEPFDPSSPPQRPTSSVRPLGTDKYRLTARAHLPTVWNTILTSKPYKIAGMLIFGANPAVSDADSNHIREALTKLDFLVVSDLFMTATAQFADIILPAASFLENEYYLNGNNAVAPPAQAWPDQKILLELGKTMGYGEELTKINARLEAERHKYSEKQVKTRYRKYITTGFHTASGKVEFYSENLQAFGFNPLPDYREPQESPVDYELSRKYPLVLTVGAKFPMYTHSQFRNIPRLRRLMTQNMILINEKTAESYNFRDGDRVVIETRTGRLEGPLSITNDIVENVIQTFHGFQEANANVLTSSAYCNLATGSPGVKSMMCRVMKVDKNSA